MLTYNTNLKKLILPEYGRTIQEMVDHCVTIEDRDERNACARAIVKAMATIQAKQQPEAKEQDGYEQKLWDHLALISDFCLDIDWPYEQMSAEVRESAPNPIPYPTKNYKHRNYGTVIQRMLDAAVAMEGGDDKDALIILLANQMKKVMAASNPTVEDERIFNDIAAMTDGAITIAPESVRLYDYRVLPVAQGNKKRKKK